MKRIFSVLFALFMVLGCATLGSVFLMNEKDDAPKSVPVDNTVYEASTRFEGYWINFYPNGASLSNMNLTTLNPNITSIYVEYGFGAGDYGFGINASGYYESKNKGADNSYSMASIYFYSQGSGTLNIKYISYGESSFDYAIFSNLDSTLSESNTADTSFYLSTKGASSSAVKTITYSGISAGWHRIYIKYRKDGSINSYNDSLQFWIALGWSKFSSYAGIRLPLGLRFGNLPTITRTGYTFSGWFTESSGGTKITESSVYNGTTKIYAQWSPVVSTLTYNANGGATPLSSTQIAYNDSYGKKNIYDPTICNLSGPISRSGNIFTVSCNNTSGGFQWGNFVQTFSGTFQPSTKYTVVYECLSYSGSGGFGITLTSPDDEGSSGNTDISNTGQCYVSVFGTGVYVSSFTTKSSFALSNMFYDLRSYTAIANGSNVTATFRVSVFVGDIIYNTFSYASKGSMPSGNLLPTPTRTGYTFDGWWTSSSGGTRIYPSTTYTAVGNSTIYAHWIAKKFNITVIKGNYGVSDITNPATYWNYNDGRDGKQISVNFGSSQTISVSIDAGYHFSHWEGDSSSTSSSITCTVDQEKNYTFVAYAAPNNYTVSFDPNGGEIPITTSGGCMGSDCGCGTVGTCICKGCEVGNLCICCQSLATPTTSKQVTYNSTYGTLPTAVRTNYTFDGWYTSVSGGSLVKSSTTYTTVGDSTLYAHWTPNLSTVTVNLRLINKDGSGGTVNSNEVGSVSISYQKLSGTTITSTTVSQTTGSTSYSAHSGNAFTITATANSGYVFTGFSTASTPSSSIANPSARPNFISTSYYPSKGNVSYYVYFKQVSANQLKYDETDKYFYFEDGYYPQSEAGLKYVSRQSGTFSGVSVSHDEKENIISLNGSYSDGVSHYLYETENLTSLKAGRSVSLKVEFLGGNYTGGGRVIFAFTYMDLNGNSLMESSTSPNLGTDDTILIDNITTNYGAGKFSIFIWRNVDDGGTPTFVNAKYRVTIIYDYLSDVATANGESFTYCNGSENVDIPVYTYNGERYVKIEKNGTTKWFKFEPIRWRISDYGVEKTETNYIKYEALRKYTGYATNFTAVSDLILGVGAMHNTREVREGTSVTSMKGFQLVEETTDGCSITFQYAKSGNVIKVDNYSTSSQNNAVSTGTTAYSAPLRIASLEEITSLGLVNKGARASDMVAFILGQDKNNVTYWTRDLSNLGSGVAITSTGTKVQTWLNQLQGMRFAYTFSEGGSIL